MMMALKRKKNLPMMILWEVQAPKWEEKMSLRRKVVLVRRLSNCHPTPFFRWRNTIVMTHHYLCCLHRHQQQIQMIVMAPF